VANGRRVLAFTVRFCGFAGPDRSSGCSFMSAYRAPRYLSRVARGKRDGAYTCVVVSGRSVSQSRNAETIWDKDGACGRKSESRVDYVRRGGALVAAIRAQFHLIRTRCSRETRPSPRRVRSRDPAERSPERAGNRNARDRARSGTLSRAIGSFNSLFSPSPDRALIPQTGLPARRSAVSYELNVPRGSCGPHFYPSLISPRTRLFGQCRGPRPSCPGPPHSIDAEREAAYEGSTRGKARARNSRFRSTTRPRAGREVQVGVTAST